MKKRKIKNKISTITYSIICSIMFIGLPLTAKAAWSETTFSAGTTGGTFEVGFLNFSDGNNYGYAKVSANGNVDAYLNGTITYATGTGTSDKSFSHESHERSYTETVCNSPSGRVSFAECMFNVHSPDGSATRYLATD